MFDITKKSILITLFLFSFFPVLSDEPKLSSQNPTAGSDKPPLSEMEKEVLCTLKSATKTHIKYDKELFERIFISAPQELKDKITLIDQIFAQKRRGEGSIQWDILPSRLLLVGAPGVGKSTLAQVVAYKLGRNFYFIRLPMLGTEYKNSEIANLNRIINQALDANEPCVIILDEINIFSERKATAFGEDNSAGSMLWLLLDKCASNSNILIIGTANDVSKLPDQLKDRFEGNVIEIVRNDWHDRYFVLNYYLSKAQHFCTDKYLVSLARKTEGFSPRQLEALVKSAQQKRFIVSGSIDLLLNEDLEKSYGKFLLSSKLLKSKSNFILKNWIKENSIIIQTVSTSLHLSVLAAGLAYAIYKNGTSWVQSGGLPKFDEGLLAY